MQNVLVTGACGFIGRELTRTLAAMGCQVRGLDLRGHSSAGIDVWPADITAQNLNPKIFEGIDTVFHLAGKVHALAETKQDDADYFRVNTRGTQHVLEAAQRAGIKRLILFSTVKAMSNDSGARAGGPSPVGRLGAFTEADAIQPDTPYGKSKLAAEKLVLASGYVPEGVVLRLCMVYGPHAIGNIEKMIEAMRQNRFPPLPELGNKRSMVHVQDVVQAAVLAGTHPKAAAQVFIVSDGQTYSTRQMYELICRALNRKVPGWTMPIGALRGLAVIGDLIGKARGRRFVFDSDALNKLTGSAWFTSEKIQSTLGFKPEWNLEKALPSMVERVARSPNQCPSVSIRG